jgi:hypothetical protein
MVMSVLPSLCQHPSRSLGCWLAPALTAEIDQGFDMDVAATGVVAARLAEPGGWVLLRAGHPADCVALLDRIVVAL